jgi:type IV secretory pathway component VirB8
MIVKEYVTYRFELEWRTLEDCNRIILASTDKTERTCRLEINAAHWTTLTRQISIASSGVE